MSPHDRTVRFDAASEAVLARHVDLFRRLAEAERAEALRDLPGAGSWEATVDALAAVLTMVLAERDALRGHRQALATIAGACMLPDDASPEDVRARVYEQVAERTRQQAEAAWLPVVLELLPLVGLRVGSLPSDLVARVRTLAEGEATLADRHRHIDQLLEREHERGRAAERKSRKDEG